MYTTAAILIAFLSVRTFAGDEYTKEFADFERKFNKRYVDDDERHARFDAFKSNYRFIARENAKGSNLYELGVNEFSDLTPEEFAGAHYGFSKPTKVWSSLARLGVHEYSGAALPDSMDWRQHGAVTAVKNQGQCGSCWSFSTTGALEGAWQIATGTLASLSEEQFVDCSTQNNGCGGGSMDLAFQFAESNAICTESSYKYTAPPAGQCHATGCTVGIPKGGVVGFKDVAQNSEQALMEALAQQPVSIAVEADKAVFQSYRSGVMTGVCGTQLDHGILAVGFGSENGQDYWLVKNSWGQSWGESGFGKLLRGKGQSGECGILSMASYPVVKATSSSIVTGDDFMEAFVDFAQRFGKSYVNDDERQARFEIFKSNYILIARENAKATNLYELGVNEFSDLTADEFAKTHYGYSKPTKPWVSLPRLGTHVYSGATLPASVDWRQQSAVTDVKNQGQCGSCWSFSTTGALEGAWKIASGNLVSLSEEQFVDCSNQNNGCGGGSMDLAFQFAESNGICTEASYSYSAPPAGKCHADGCVVGIPKGGVAGFKDVAQNSEQALMEALAQQPVSIAVEADKTVFQSYRSGVMTGTCGTKLDHGILAVGYGSENGQDYWLVKNSWGPSWGQSGYAKLLRGKGQSGECGILSMASYPVVTGANSSVVVV